MTGPDQQTGSMRVLIVHDIDDHAIVREGQRALLETEPGKVRVVVGGEVSR